MCFQSFIRSLSAARSSKTICGRRSLVANRPLFVLARNDTEHRLASKFLRSSCHRYPGAKAPAYLDGSMGEFLLSRLYPIGYRRLAKAFR